MNETKTATKHTPGKWVANGIRVLNENEDAVIAKVANSADTTTKWQCCTASFENESNARLIAAAPDLLEALGNLIHHAERDIDEMDDLADCEEAEEEVRDARIALKRARAAIARAEGGAA